MFTKIATVFAVSFGIAALGAFDGAAVVSNHLCSAGSSVSSGSMSSGIMDLESPNDAGAELDGMLTNHMNKPIRAVRVWFEKPDGTKLCGSNGGSPVTGLSSHPGPVGTLHAASLVSNADGVATFNLVGQINPQAVHNYEAQVDKFAEPNRYEIRMSFSAAKATSGLHYEYLDDLTMTADSAQEILDGAAPTVRTGVMFTVKNGDPTRPIRWVQITLASNVPMLMFTGGESKTSDDSAVSGVTVALSNSKRTITFSDLWIGSPEWLSFWLDLNKEYDLETAFKVRVGY